MSAWLSVLRGYRVGSFDLGDLGGSRCRVGRFDFDGKVDVKVWVAPG